MNLSKRKVDELRSAIAEYDLKKMIKILSLDKTTFRSDIALLKVEKNDGEFRDQHKAWSRANYQNSAYFWIRIRALLKAFRSTEKNR
jgi:lipopolysaccharide biosynthesis regulator YciM